MSAVNNQWPPLITAYVDNTPADATSISGVLASGTTITGGLPSGTTIVGGFPSGTTISSVLPSPPRTPHYHTCWQPNQTGAFVGAVFGGIAIGLIIASWVALFVAWRRAKARAVRAITIRDLEQRVGRESFNSADFRDADRSEDKLPLLLQFEQDRDERRSVDDEHVEQ